MSAQWKPKPGDLFIGAGGHIYYAIEVAANTRTAWRDGFHAIRADGNGYPVEAIADPRPLLVIDPEDHEAVKRLLMLVYPLDASVLKRTGRFDHLQQALREFANPTPPRPDEPTGLGAVVEDDKALRWVRLHPGGEAWINQYERASMWSDINAVRVLSEGVGEVAGDE